MFSSVAPVRVQRGSSRSTNGSDAELPALMPASHSHTHWPSPWAGPRLHGVEPDADDPMEDLSLGVPLQQAHPPTERVLGIVAVAMISFFNVSGGPIGSEQTIAVAGPAVGLTALGVMWLAFAVPQALVTAELSSAFPQNGGYSLWVETAFGRFWGIQESYWSWCSGVVDNALYPVLLYSTLTALFRDEWAMVDDGGADEQEDLPNLWACIGTSECSRAYLIKLLITILFTIPNIVSVNLVGQGLQVLCVLVLAPYVLLSAIAFAKADPARWAWSERPADGTVDWTTLLTLLYWNVSGWDCASTFAGEVKEPGRTYPRALGMALLIMLAAYAVPLLAASGCVDAGDWRLWKDGSFASIAQGVGGEWLGVLIVSSAALGNWGLFASELLEDSYQLLGMAEAGLAPRMFSRRHPKFHTPVSAILFQFTIICVLIGFDFNTILTVDNFFSAAQAVLEFVAFVKLRVSRPDLERPFRVPLSTAGSIAMLSIPTALACATSLACVTASLGAACVNGVAVLGGIALYLLAGDKCTGCLPKFGRRRRAAAAHAAHAPACEPRIDGLREGLLPRPEPEEAGQLH